MASHVVNQGECLRVIAKRYGQSPAQLWNHSTNADLKQLRRNPNVLCPGDVVQIPDSVPKQVVAPAGKEHKFQARRTPVRLKLKLKRNGQARADQPFIVRVGGETLTGTTTGDGGVDVPIPESATEATLELTETHEKFVLRLGHLDPASTVAGAQARLQQLGFYAGEIDGRESKTLARALKTFQKKQGLTESGELDDASIDALESSHGC